MPRPAVSTAVHDTLGGVVEHRGTDATDLSEQAKLLQRLYALNVVQFEGHYPNLSLWKVGPGGWLMRLYISA